MAAKQRAAKAMEMRDQGATLEAIAQALGYSGRAAVHNAIDRELDRMIEHSAVNMRKRENRKLDLIEAAVMPIALGGGEKALWAVDREMQIMARRHKLNGLDADTQELLRAMPYQKRIVLDESPPQGLPQGELSTPQISPVRQLQAGPVTISDTEPGL
jgi:hypothetical protein